MPVSVTLILELPCAIDVWSIAVEDVFVTLPLASIVNIGIAVDDPTVPADTPEAASVIAPLSLAVASPENKHHKENLLYYNHYKKKLHRVQKTTNS